MAAMLVQFQCQREGTLFYYQHYPQEARALVAHCPLCGSKRVRATGRAFPGVDEVTRLPAAYIRSEEAHRG